MTKPLTRIAGDDYLVLVRDGVLLVMPVFPSVFRRENGPQEARGLRSEFLEDIGGHWEAPEAPRHVHPNHDLVGAPPQPHRGLGDVTDTPRAGPPPPAIANTQSVFFSFGLPKLRKFRSNIFHISSL